MVPEITATTRANRMIFVYLNFFLSITAPVSILSLFINNVQNTITTITFYIFMKIPSYNIIGIVKPTIKFLY